LRGGLSLPLRRTLSHAVRRNTLNTKVFKKMGFALQKEELDSLSNCTPQAVERMLKKLQQNMAKYGARKQAGEADDDAAPTGAAKAYKPPPKPPARAVTVPKAPAMSGGVARKVVATNGGAGSCEGGGGVPGAPVSISEPSMARLEGGDAGGYEGLLDEKDAQLTEMRETVEILEVKIQKLEQLVRLKDSKIATLQAKLAQAGI